MTTYFKRVCPGMYRSIKTGWEIYRVKEGWQVCDDKGREIDIVNTLTKAKATYL